MTSKTAIALRMLSQAAQAAATLLVVAAATFVLMHKIPGGPFHSERRLPPAIEANLNQRYGLDKPLPVQFMQYLGRVARLDFGPSFTEEGRTVNQIIGEAFPKSAAVGGAAFALAGFIGIPLGVGAALLRHRRGGGCAGQGAEAALTVAAVAGVSVPSFLLAAVVQYWFAYRLNWLPAAGWGEGWAQLVLPVAALAAFPVAFVSRLVRASVLAVLDEDYLRTARAKGLGAAQVVLRHGLRNALLPTLTYAGPLLAGLLTGSFVVENIFALPGLGRQFVTSINNRDYTAIMGVTLFYTALVVGANLLTELIYPLLDPRLREQE